MLWLLAAFLSLPLWAADLESIRQETNLEKRSQLAMDFAATALDAARKEYDAGDMANTQAAIQQVGDAVDLAYQSLVDTGKDARRSPRYFKRAELATRRLLRRIEGLADSMSYQDRPQAEKLRDRVSAVHDDLVNALMSKKR